MTTNKASATPRGAEEAPIRNEATVTAEMPAYDQMCLVPDGRVYDVAVCKPRPAIVILVHGVNDLGVSYHNQEAGICKGLAERLDRADGHPAGVFTGAQYSLPADDKGAKADPDAVYYRRKHNTHRNSMVIPFYWGYRAEEGVAKNPHTGRNQAYVRRNTVHGEYLDRYGNRLDKDAAKNGGPFANATTTIPDMYEAGFSGKMMGVSANKVPFASSPTHPLFQAGDRRYMVLAAKRLVMLVKMIRKKSPGDTINLVAHSQGCMISLLANAYLLEEGQPAVDGLIMNHPPYGLKPTWAEGKEMGRRQQTASARVETLVNIVQGMTSNPSRNPTFSDLAYNKSRYYISGPRWKPGAGATKTVNGINYNFEERDNRGKVYLYFCSVDRTVSLLNVQGIGWKGVSDDVLPKLGKRFFQRIFTSRKRDGKFEEVGSAPHTYEFIKGFEIHAKVSPITGRGGFDFNQVQITGEPLNPVCQPDLGPGELGVDPVDASIAITYKGIKSIENNVRVNLDNPAKILNKGKVYRMRDGEGKVDADYEALCKQLEDKINPGVSEPIDRHWVSSVRKSNDGSYLVNKTETPRQARNRWMKEKEENSFHSGIVSNQVHSRLVTAYDLAMGKARNLNNENWYYYLCLVADWRTRWDDTGIILKVGGSYLKDAIALHNSAQAAPFKQLVKDTNQYYVRTVVTAHSNIEKVPSKIDELVPLNDKIPSLIVNVTEGATQKYEY